MKIMITGAQFNNKGAQSLLFTVIDQLKKRNPEVEIYYLPIDDYRMYEKEKYRFHIIYGGMDAHYYENKVYMRLPLLAKAVLRKIIKGKKAVAIKEITVLHKILPQIDAIIDVSGFQLTSKFPNDMNRRFLYYIEEAKRYSKKIILMPQSFGPFNYTKKKEEMLALIQKDLKEADLIFAREKEGYQLLTENFKLQNVYCSMDLVLQSTEIDWNNIYTQVPRFTYPQISGDNNVAIIPNTETLKHGNEEEIIKLYRKIIQHLLNKGKKVHIFRHSCDLQICEKIYSNFKNEENVFLYKNEFECAEYSLMIKQFEFIIASRFHAIVHAYKEGIPAIILGWAIKYQDLAENFDQQKFVFNITNNPVEQSENIIEMLDYMCSNYTCESEKIEDKMKTAVTNSCFDLCWTVLEN